MDKYDIKITDWYRILFGEASSEIIIGVPFFTVTIVSNAFSFRIAPN